MQTKPIEQSFMQALNDQAKKTGEGRDNLFREALKALRTAAQAEGIRLHK